MNEITTKSLRSPKDRNEIRHLIEDSLENNKELGFLHNNLLHIQDFGAYQSLDQIFLTLGILSFLLCGLEQIDSYTKGIIVVIAICFFISSFIFNKLLKFYLVYDIDREVFYNITKINDSTISKSKEIFTKDIIELGVNQTFLDKGGRRITGRSAFFYKGNINDNPGIKTTFVVLKRNGEIVDLTYPMETKQAEANAVAACKLFSDCFGLNSVICEKKDYLKVVKDQNQNYIFEKASLVQEMEKRKELFYKLIIPLFIGLGVLTFLIILLILFLLIALHK